MAPTALAQQASPDVRPNRLDKALITKARRLRRRERLRETSLFHPGQMTKPLIVLQGANDPRVIKPELDEIVDGIKKKNGIVEYGLR